MAFELSVDGDNSQLTGTWVGETAHFDPVVWNASEHLYGLGYGSKIDEETELTVDWSELDDDEKLNVLDMFFQQQMLGSATSNQQKVIHDATTAAETASAAEVAGYQFGNEEEE